MALTVLIGMSVVANTHFFILVQLTLNVSIQKEAMIVNVYQAQNVSSFKILDNEHTHGCKSLIIPAIVY